MQALLSRSVVAVSSKLSVAAVLGLAALPLLLQDASSRPGAPPPQVPAAPVELAHAGPTPLTTADPADPALKLVAARRRSKRQRPDTSAAGQPPPAHKTSAITPTPEAAPPSPQPAAEAKPSEAPPVAAEAAPTQAPAPQKAQSARHGDDKPAKKISSIAPPQLPKAEPPKIPAPPPDAKPNAGQAEPPKPETWSDAEIIAGLRECVRLLAPIASEVELAQPVRHEQCGAPAPVLVKRIGSGANKVEINPPAELNCAMVVSLHAWVEKTLQPAAREALGSPVARLRNASGYVCRARNGHPLGTDKLSEHALANAIDIAGFITASGRTVDVSRSWGPTERDRREAERIAAAHARQKAKSGKEAGPDAAGNEARPEPTQRIRVNGKISLISHKIEAPTADKSPASKLRDARSASKTAALERSRRTSDISTDPTAIPAPPASGHDDGKKATEAAFLRRLHKGACAVFGTVLGPEANELHRDHFHFDLASRRHSAYCQ